MTPLELVAYYANLLILQYLGKPKAYATVATAVAPVLMPQVSAQTISFSDISVAGSFILKYGSTQISVNWNDSTSSIQLTLRIVTGSTSLTVTGSIADQSLTVTFNGVVAPLPIPLLVISDNTLVNSLSDGIETTITQIDQTLPLAVQNGFNLTGSNTAIGAQLDILGKYAGVSRNYGTTNLDDESFLLLIRFAIGQNNSGSSLLDIETSLNNVLPGEFVVTDSQDMRIAYLFNGTLINPSLLNVLIGQNLLPKPMGVALSVVTIPTVADLFGFRTYDNVNLIAKPFNDYDAFNTTWVFLSYSGVITV